MKEYLTHRIATYWQNAKIDYDVNGKFLYCEIDGDRLLIKWEEEGTRYTMVIHHYKQYTPEQVFDIWMEDDWAFWAD